MKLLFGAGQPNRKARLSPNLQAGPTDSGHQGLMLLAAVAENAVPEPGLPYSQGAVAAALGQENASAKDSFTFDCPQVPLKAGANALKETGSYRRPYLRRNLSSAFSVWQRPQAPLAPFRVDDAEAENLARYNEHMSEELFSSALSQPRPKVKRLLEYPDVLPEWVQRAFTKALEQAGNGSSQRMNGIVALLLGSPKVDINLTDGKDAPFILKAIQAQNEPAFWELLSHPQLDPNQLFKVWNFALTNKNTALMQWLLDHPKMTASMINRGYTIQRRQGQPVYLSLFEAAIKRRHLPLAKLIAKHPKFEINTPMPGTNITPLCQAVKEGQTELVEAILNRSDLQLDKPHHCPQSQQAVYLAAEGGTLPILQRLVNRGINLNATTEPNGLTALVTASRQGHTEMVQWMVPRVFGISSLPLSDRTGLTRQLMLKAQKHVKRLKPTPQG